MIDWTECSVVERVPGRRGGQPVIRHSRVRPEDLLENASEGPEWLAENHELRLEDVVAVLAFHRQHESRLASAT